jgi:predicted Zn-dependent peptidase
LNALRRGEIDEVRFAEAKVLLIGRRALAMESNMSHAVWLESLSYFYEDNQPLPDYESSVEAVSLQDIVRAAQTYLAPDRLVAVVHVPLL